MNRIGISGVGSRGKLKSNLNRRECVLRSAKMIEICTYSSTYDGEELMQLTIEVKKTEQDIPGTR